MHKILVVDDDKMNLILAKKLLEKDYEVFIADSGVNALKILNENSIDLILLDIQMPDMNGFELITKINSIKSIPVIFLTADRSEETEAQCFEMGAVDFISKPFVPSIMLKRIHRSIKLEDYQKNLEKIVQEQLKRILILEQNTIIMLANVIESRDGVTGQHVKKTSAYVDFLIQKMKEKNVYCDKITPTFSDAILRAAPLHDVGKIAISDSILQKKGSLSPEEFELMKKHTIFGGKLIKENMSDVVDKQFVDIAINIAVSHHEHWDGSGYPNKLCGEKIPLCARIVTIADVFDAMTSKRSYKEQFSIEDTIKIMEKDKGKIFDPVLLEAFTSDIEGLSKICKSFTE